MASRAAIFDLDGTLVDSGALHHRSWRRLCAELGRPLMTDAEFKACFGHANATIVPELLGRAPVDDEVVRCSERKEAIYRELAGRELTLFPGARELLLDLRAAGWGIAIGSSTPRSNLDFLVPHLGLDELVQVTVGMEDVARHKPFPDVFAECARRLGAAPARSLVFEDAPAGVAAGLAAGMTVVALLTHHPASSLTGAVTYVQGLWEVSAADCARWLGSEECHVCL
jgi:beta-phosphoglucomutase